jgi:hypothetical protein
MIRPTQTQAIQPLYAFWIALFAALIVVYLLPTLIGMARLWNGWRSCSWSI